MSAVRSPLLGHRAAVRSGSPCRHRALAHPEADHRRVEERRGSQFRDVSLHHDRRRNEAVEELQDQRGERIEEQRR
jgi:hypothetical protein